MTILGPVLPILLLLERILSPVVVVMARIIIMVGLFDLFGASAVELVIVVTGALIQTRSFSRRNGNFGGRSGRGR